MDDLDEILENDDIEKLLERIDDFVVDNIIANNDEPNKTGFEYQRIYDQIRNQNEDMFE